VKLRKRDELDTFEQARQWRITFVLSAVIGVLVVALMIKAGWYFSAAVAAAPRPVAIKRGIVDETARARVGA
jgi:uncharacterized membrane protein AbrB (regulator of aidB expression)